MKRTTNSLNLQTFLIQLSIIVCFGCTNTSPTQVKVSKDTTHTSKSSSRELIRPPQLTGFYISKRMYSFNYLHLDSTGYGNAKINTKGLENNFPILNLDQFGWYTNSDTSEVIISYKDRNNLAVKHHFKLTERSDSGLGLVFRGHFEAMFFTKVREEDLKLVRP